MTNLLRWVWFCGLMIGCFVGVTAFFNWLLGEHRPLWTGVVFGVMFLLGTLLLSYSERRGWIKGLMWNRDEVERRRKELADAREQILAEARTRSNE